MPRPNQLLRSVALTRSEISSRSPDAATLARRTVTANDPLLSSGNVLPTNCAVMRRLTSVNGTSIGTAMLTPPCSVCGAISSVAGNGHSGLVSVGTIRVSASTPISNVTASASIRGCAAIARLG